MRTALRVMNTQISFASPELLPEACRGLWSYSNAGFVLAGRECETAAGIRFSAAVRDGLTSEQRSRADDLASRIQAFRDLIVGKAFGGMQNHPSADHLKIR